MEIFKAPVIRSRNLGIASLVVGFLGGAFYWWAPTGTVLSLTGLMIGLAGWIEAGRKTRGASFSIVGMLVSALALILNLVIAYLGLEIIKIHALY